MSRRSRKPTKTFKRLKKPQQPRVHTRGKPRLTRRAFDAMCVDVLKRKAQAIKQRVNDHALRVLWQDLVTCQKTEPTKKVLWKRLMEVFDQCAAPLISVADLPFEVDAEKVWRLAPGVSLRQPEQWAVRRIIGSFMKDGIRYFEVEWENTIEPMAYVPAHLIHEFDRTHRREIEKAFIEAEAVEERSA